jgi:dipeptidyl aminopeptidase/acylaminoacyl peptidase
MKKPKTARRLSVPSDARRLNWPSSPALSPDGKWVAFVGRRADPTEDKFVSSIWLAAVDGGEPARLFTTTGNAQSPVWSPSGESLAYLINTGKGSQIFVASLAGGEPRPLTSGEQSCAEPCWSPDGTRIAFVRGVKPKATTENKAAPVVIRDIYYKSDGAGLLGDVRRHVYVVDVATGAERQITDGDWHDAEPRWSPDGKRIAFISERHRARWNRYGRSAIWIVDANGGRARRLTPDDGNVAGPRFSPDGRTIAYTGRLVGGSSYRNHAVLLVDTRGDSKPRALTDRHDLTVGNMTRLGSHIEWSPNGKSIVFLGLERGAALIWRGNVATGAVRKILDGDIQASAIALSSDGRRAVYIGAWTTQLPELFVVDLQSLESRQITHINGELADALERVSTHRVVYPSFDGLPIEAFVLYPPNHSSRKGRRGKRHPLIVSIHGGPHGSHPAIFNPLEAQIYAAAGYVVLLPNPRGSVSYGEAFAQACVGDWGGGDYRDIMAGVDHLIERGVVDPNRLYVEGYSYGGYMAAWIVTQTDRFRAAVSGAPVTDLVSCFGTDDILHVSIEAMGGSPFELMDEYYRRSPYTFVECVTTPVLLMHWEGDLRDPISQSEQFFKGLKFFGKEAEFVRYPGGAHGVRTPFQAIDLLERTLEWFARHSGRASR